MSRVRKIDTPSSLELDESREHLIATIRPEKLGFKLGGIVLLITILMEIFVLSQTGFSLVAISGISLGLFCLGILILWGQKYLCRKVIITAKGVAVKQYPFGVFRTLFIPAAKIDQVYVRKIVHSGDTTSSFSYELRVKKINRKKETVLLNKILPEEAVYFEQKIETFFNIADRPMPHEMTSLY